MKQHQFEPVGALQWRALGLPSYCAEAYNKCALCGATVAVRYNDGEGLSDALVRSGVSKECPNGVEPIAGGKKIFAFCNGGSPGWYSAMAICEDGHVVAQHICSSEGWIKHDLGIGSTSKHDNYAKHCPEGYELVWVDNPKTHEGLQAAYRLNQELLTSRSPLASEVKPKPLCK